MPLAVNTVKDYSTNTHILLDIIKYAILHKMFQGSQQEYMCLKFSVKTNIGMYILYNVVRSIFFISQNSFIRRKKHKTLFM